MQKDRLFCLDVLRGLDMLLLCVIAPMICEFAGSFGFEDHPFLSQFGHYWDRFTLYDMIMPLFIFMSGAAVPFALRKRLDGRGCPRWPYWKHVLKRVAFLWALGMAAQGDLLSFDPLKINPYCNALQSIAAGYLFCAAVLPIRKWQARAAITLSLLVVYTLLMTFGGDYTPEGNFAHKVDVAVLGFILPKGSACLPPGKYTWWLSTMAFSFTALTGMHMTEVLRSACGAWRKASVMGAIGAGLVVLGLVAVACGIPCIKMISTTSFTLISTGISTLLLAALFVLTDIWHVRRGWGLVMLYGQASLAAYVIGAVWPQVPRYAATLFTYGIPNLFGDSCMRFVNMTVSCVFITAALWLWTRSCVKSKKG